MNETYLKLNSIKCRKCGEVFISLVKENNRYNIYVENVIVYLSTNFNRALSYYNCISFAYNKTQKVV